MGPIIDIPEMFDRDRRVFLGCRQTRMAEELLDLSKIGAHIE
jgi:hypothetical protein